MSFLPTLGPSRPVCSSADLKISKDPNLEEDPRLYRVQHGSIQPPGIEACRYALWPRPGRTPRLKQNQEKHNSSLSDTRILLLANTMCASAGGPGRHDRLGTSRALRSSPYPKDSVGDWRPTSPKRGQLYNRVLVSRRGRRQCPETLLA